MLGEDRKPFFEDLHLAQSVFRIEHFGRREVRAHSFQASGASHATSFSHKRGSASFGAPRRFMPVSTFRCTGKTICCFARPPCSRRSMCHGLPDRGSQILGDDAVFLALPDSGHQQDAGSERRRRAAPSLRRHWSRPAIARPRLRERERAFDRAVTVAIGFDHRADRDAWADVLLYRVEIFSQSGERNFRPGAAVENQRAAARAFSTDQDEARSLS